MAGLKEREEKRKQSIVGALIDNGAEEEVVTNQKEDAGKDEQVFTIKPKKKEETRSKRVNLLMQPSTYIKAQKKCKKLGISINECVNQFLEGWTAEEDK